MFYRTDPFRRAQKTTLPACEPWRGPLAAGEKLDDRTLVRSCLSVVARVSRTALWPLPLGWLGAALVLAGFGSLNSPAASPAEGRGAAKSFAAELKSLETDVIAKPDRAAAVRALPDLITRELRAAGDKSTAAWNQLATRADWETFRTAKVQALQAALKIDPAPGKLLASRVVKEISGDGFVVKNVLYESRPGWWVSANLYCPAKPAAKSPGILLSHSHHSPKQQGELQDMGMTWARAGCYVLVPDHLGHGERRQHPFASASAYPKPFPVSREDYYYRYDESLQLYLADQTLMGWLAWDLMRGVDFLLQQPHIDPQRILLFGSVAGGGDIAAVTAALDSRIAAAAVFNFGGPQPETRYPLPADAEKTFDYVGSGSWESTRNLIGSAADGFLPWVIVGSIAPRRLVYGHEFSWDQAHDPVWRRLSKIYQDYGAADHLASAHGFGTLKGKPPEASHCDNIGPAQRQGIHEALAKWFQIRVSPDAEYRKRLSADELTCWNDALKQELKPKSLVEVLAERTKYAAREPAAAPAPLEGARHYRCEASEPTSAAPHLLVQRLLYKSAGGLRVPALILQPKGSGARPLVICLSQFGKQAFLEQRRAAVGELLAANIGVLLIDLPGTGETQADSQRGRSSYANDLAASLLMLNSSLLAVQAQALQEVVADLETRAKPASWAVWADGLTEPAEAAVPLTVPYQAEGRPSDCEPASELIALKILTPRFSAAYFNRGVSRFGSAFDHSALALSLDSIEPGIVVQGDLSARIERHPEVAYCFANSVDVRNRPVSRRQLESDLPARMDPKTKLPIHLDLSVDDDALAPAEWLKQQLVNSIKP